jgi:uncharacterized phiE125 gp8 family phage protein
MRHQTTPPTALPLHLDTVKRHLTIEHDNDDALLSSYINAAVAYVENYTGLSLVQQGFEATFCQFKRKMRLSPLPVLVVDSVQYIDPAGYQKTLTEFVLHPYWGALRAANNQQFPCALPVDDAIAVNYQAGILVPVTVNSSTDRLTAIGIAFENGQKINLCSNHTLPVGLSAATSYYVVNSAVEGFQLALTESGTAINLTDVGVGNQFVGIIKPDIIHAMLLLIGHWYNNREDSVLAITITQIATGVKDLLNPHRIMGV